VRAMRSLSVVALVLLAVVLLPGPVRAAGSCGSRYVGPMSQIERFGPTIAVARLVATRFGGTGLDLEVQTVIAGRAHVGRWSYGPRADPRPIDICIPPAIPKHARVFLIIWPPGRNTDLYTWWAIPASGRVPRIFTDQTATTLVGLVAELRAVLPATSTEAEEPPISSPVVPILAIGSGLLAFLAFLAGPDRVRATP
jgi:hypothetical protein